MNQATRRSSKLVALLMLSLVALLCLAGRGAAAPYNPGSGSIAGSTTSPAEGASMTVRVTGAVANHRIVFRLEPGGTVLGSYVAGIDGVAQGSVTMPAGLTGRYTIVATDALTHQSWSLVVTIGGLTPSPGTTPTADPSSAAAHAAKDGSLAYTGVAVIGLAGVALLMLVGGGVLLVAGRRHGSRTR